jgi:hypothetical protein
MKQSKKQENPIEIANNMTFFSIFVFAQKKYVNGFSTAKEVAKAINAENMGF